MTRWPFPGDTELDKARRIALGYRQALLTADPATCAVLDAAADEFGQRWVTGTLGLALDPDGWYPAVVVADALCIEPTRVRMWAQRDKVAISPDPADGRALYNLRDCQDLLAGSRRTLPCEVARDAAT